MPEKPSEILRDPEFLELPLGEQLKVMRSVDPEFTSLPLKNQGTVLARAKQRYMGTDKLGEKPKDEGFFGTLKKDVMAIPGALINPLGTVRSLAQAQHEQFEKGRSDLERGEYLSGAGHMAAGALPVLGPMAATVGEEVGSGQYGQAAAHALELGLPYLKEIPAGKIARSVGQALPTPKTSPSIIATMATKLPSLSEVQKFLIKRVPMGSTLIDSMELLKKQYGEKLEKLEKPTRDDVAYQLFEEKYGKPATTGSERLQALQEMKTALSGKKTAELLPPTQGPAPKPPVDMEKFRALQEKAKQAPATTNTPTIEPTKPAQPPSGRTVPTVEQRIARAGSPIKASETEPTKQPETKKTSLPSPKTEVSTPKPFPGKPEGYPETIQTKKLEAIDEVRAKKLGATLKKTKIRPDSVPSVDDDAAWSVLEKQAGTTSTPQIRKAAIEHNKNLWIEDQKELQTRREKFFAKQAQSAKAPAPPSPSGSEGTLVEAGRAVTDAEKTKALTAIKKLQSGEGNYVGTDLLHGEGAVDPDVLFALANDGKIVLARYDGPKGPGQNLKHMVEDSKGNIYIGAAVRRGAEEAATSGAASTAAKAKPQQAQMLIDALKKAGIPAFETSRMTTEEWKMAASLAGMTEAPTAETIAEAVKLSSSPLNVKVRKKK